MNTRSRRYEAILWMVALSAGIVFPVALAGFIQALGPVTDAAGEARTTTQQCARAASAGPLLRGALCPSLLDG